jgi:hypothetical protein
MVGRLGEPTDHGGVAESSVPPNWEPPPKVGFFRSRRSDWLDAVDLETRGSPRYGA